MTVHKAGQIWQLNQKRNWWVNNLKCVRCNKGFEKGQWVVQATTTPRRDYMNHHKGYARIRHIECFVDAKGNPIRNIPNGKK
jgi:hypothetical protein